MSIPEIPSQTPGLSITRTTCTSDANVVAIDMEKMENKRKRNARMRTPLEIYIHQRKRRREKWENSTYHQWGSNQDGVRNDRH